MAETQTDTTAETELEPLRLRDDEGHVVRAFVDAVEDALDRNDAEVINVLCSGLHEADLGDLIEALYPESRQALIRMMGDDFDFAVLTEVDDSIRARLLEDMPSAELAEGIGDLESDDAVYILEDLEEEAQEEILGQMPQAEQMSLRRALDYPEDSAGRLMQSDFIAVPPFWTVGQSIDYMREADDLPDEFYQIFVIDPAFRLQGAVALDRLLRTKRGETISSIMADTRHPVKATEDQEEVARLFQRYNLVSAAVVDDAERLVGVLTVDDIVDVIHEEAEEDILGLAGVRDAEISDTILDTLKGRFMWLLLNLGTAVLASLVIGLYDATIEQMVALAILMPIVASMGGNSGTQTMTVAVRALATRELDTHNSARIIVRETAVGFLNGVMFAVVIGVLAGLWFSSLHIGGVIGAAMIINMVAAGAAGILIPLLLDRLGIDPALASGVFLTTITDVVGFFAFLGLAAWWFGLG